MPQLFLYPDQVGLSIESRGLEHIAALRYKLLLAFHFSMLSVLYHIHLQLVFRVNCYIQTSVSVRCYWEATYLVF